MKIQQTFDLGSHQEVTREMSVRFGQSHELPPQPPYRVDPTVRHNHRARKHTKAFRQHMVELVRGGHTPAQLAGTFRCGKQSIASWVALDTVERARGEKSALVGVNERNELARLRQENEKLKASVREVLARVSDASERLMGQAA